VWRQWHWILFTVSLCKDSRHISSSQNFLLSYFVRARISIVKFLTNRNKRFQCELMLRMNRRPSCEYTMFTYVQRLRNWREKRPSYEGDVDSTVTAEVRRVYYMGVDLLLIPFSYLRLHLVEPLIPSGVVRTLERNSFWVTFQMVHPTFVCILLHPIDYSGRQHECCSCYETLQSPCLFYWR
jgi:hypothetical protein